MSHHLCSFQSRHSSWSKHVYWPAALGVPGKLAQTSEINQIFSDWTLWHYPPCSTVVISETEHGFKGHILHSLTLCMLLYKHLAKCDFFFVAPLEKKTWLAANQVDMRQFTSFSILFMKIKLEKETGWLWVHLKCYFLPAEHYFHFWTPIRNIPAPLLHSLDRKMAKAAAVGEMRNNKKSNLIRGKKNQ